MTAYLFPSIFNGCWLIVTILLICLSKRAKTGIRFQPRTTLLQLVWALGLALFFIAAMVLVNILYGVPAGLLISSLFGFLKYGTVNTLIFFAFQLLVSITEELFFRGWLLSVLQIKLHPALPIIITALLFGMIHLVTSGLTSFIFSTVLGLVFAFAKIKFKSCSVYSLMLAHLLYNLAFT